MYVPPVFKTDEIKALDFAAERAFGTVVAVDNGVPVATHVPLYIDRSRYEYREVGQKAGVEVKAEGPDMTLDHVANFLDCVKSRQKPNGDVLIGHRSAQASHLGNLAYLQKRRLNFDPQREEILPL